MIIRGARQVGKTWLIREFARTNYQNSVYINFDNNDQMKTLFAGDYDISRIISGLEVYSGAQIDPKTTLLIFDEVQQVPLALTSLKYFNENAPQYQIVCAGSLLGIALQGTSFPVGKVEFMDLYPLSFSEFLLAIGEERFVELLEGKDYEMMNTFSSVYSDLLKKYYYVGGMPEVVATFAANGDYLEVKEIQRQILSAYEQDFSKHAPDRIVPRIRMLWNNISVQLAKENKKIYLWCDKIGGKGKGL